MANSAVPDLSPRLTAAFDMARRVHSEDSIKGTDVPYLVHLLDVASILLRHSGDEDQAIAAFLQDVVEDGGGEPMLAEIRDEFGERVGDIVLSCSDSLEVDPTAKLPWWTRKIAYIDHLHVATHDVAMVSAADKLSNARSIVADFEAHGDAVWENFKTGRMGTLWYHRRIADILPSRLPDADRPQRLGTTLTCTVHGARCTVHGARCTVHGARCTVHGARCTVHELVEAVGASAAASDWHDAVAEETTHRAALADS
jgi:hypothetical protein